MGKTKTKDIHASTELIEAMRGIPPPSSWRNYPENLRACSTSLVWSEVNVMSSVGWPGERDAYEDTEQVTCPLCLVLMREATDFT